MCPVAATISKVQTFVGCGVAAGTAACLIADPETLGSLTPVCAVGTKHTTDHGLSDCIEGLSEMLASAFDRLGLFDLSTMQSRIQAGDIVGGYQSAIDYACVSAKYPSAPAPLITYQRAL
jgi:hypothetical protein